MIEFVIPPRLSGGTVEIGSASLGLDDFTWKDIDPSDPTMVNEAGERTTRIGKAEVDGEAITLVLGYREADSTPFISFTRLGRPERDLRLCSFDFEEVRS